MMFGGCFEFPEVLEDPCRGCIATSQLFHDKFPDVRTRHNVKAVCVGAIRSRSRPAMMVILGDAIIPPRLLVSQ